MRKTRGHVIHVESLADLDRRLASGATQLGGWRIHELDLSDRTEVLLSKGIAGATFLGCTFGPGEAERIGAAGGLVLPMLGTVPIDPYRSRLYTAEDLYDTPDYSDSYDAMAYSWSQTGRGQDDHLAATLHDHAIDDALATWRAPRRLAGVMGAHAAVRGDATYLEAAALGHDLGAHLTLATGGGPGAMEAVNLGARFARAPRQALDEAISMLAAVPSFQPSVDRWLRTAQQVLATAETANQSLGIPTWHYGHEPANVFATAIAKYVHNATREAILLEICDAGIVFLPGAGGTVQEIFQDACENYYADETSVAPMVLVGVEYWTETLPAWPLLRSLARGRPMEEHVHLVSTVTDAVALLSDR
ncbi:LOG family protein [Nocardioides sp.]|uniref:LOG family protein n=1 Tax=Nocardioides sp. TaxID=35761 RepID=UPI003564A6BF